MSKVPVMGTVSRAYGFLLGEFATIFRLTWAPLLVGAGLSYFYAGQAMDAAIAAGANADPAATMEYLPVQFLISMITFVTGIMASVALFQVVISGDRKPGLFVYLWLGGAELRLILVSMLLVVAVLAAGFAAALVLGVLGVLAAAIPVLSVVLSIGTMVLFVAAIWAAARLSLVAPVVIAESNLGVERSWALTRGNAPRMLAILFLTFVPYLLIAIFVFFAVMGGDMPAFPAPADMGPLGADKDGAASKAAMEGIAKAMEVWQLDLMKAMRLHWAELCVLGFAGNLVTTALGAGALGSAYTAIAGEHRA